jgi:ABC-type multidrug transport system ATPase subunit
MIGYVPQDDIIHKQLTVYKCLYYAAKLRLPGDTPESEIDKIINEVLKTLELEERRNTLITKLSGGQRKRVNIGVELVTKPTLLFLDEPTSGLDPRTESKMMALFRQLADQGRTVLLTTHVMASLTQLDKIIVLVKGKLAYFGPGSELTDYFSVENPSDVFDKLETLSPQEWKERFLKSPQYTEYVTKPLATKDKAPAPQTAAERAAAKKKPDLQQFLVQTRRYSEIKFNDRIFSAILLIQAPLLAGLDILVTTTNGARLLFLIIFGAIWYGFTNATREIVGEQPIYKRERQTGLGIPSYVFSKVVVLGVIALAQCLLTIGTLTMFGHMDGHFWLSLIIMFATAFNGVLLGLLVSAMVRSTELAITFGVVALFPQILFAGLLVPLDNIQSMRKIDITARRMAEISGKPVPPGSLGDVVVKTIEEPVTAIDGMSKSVQVISKAIVTRWGLEALADVYTKGEKKYPRDHEGLLAIQNSYVHCLIWLVSIAILLTVAILLVQKQKDLKT